MPSSRSALLLLHAFLVSVCCLFNQTSGRQRLPGPAHLSLLTNLLQGLRVLRPRILAFLGRCGAAAEAIARSAALQMPPSGSSAAASPAASSEATDALLQWDLHRRAGLMLPFGDIGRLQLWLDPLLPQVQCNGCHRGSIDRSLLC